MLIDIDDIKEGAVVYLQFMRFPDTNEIDCRLKGRPYYIYKIVEDMVYLFAIRSRKYITTDYFYKIERTKIRWK